MCSSYPTLYRSGILGVLVQKVWSKSLYFDSTKTWAITRFFINNRIFLVQPQSCLAFFWFVSKFSLPYLSIMRLKCFWEWKLSSCAIKSWTTSIFLKISKHFDPNLSLGCLFFGLIIKKHLWWSMAYYNTFYYSRPWVLTTVMMLTIIGETLQLFLANNIFKKLIR